MSQEAQIEAVLQEMDIDLLVLARYMQIFSEDFCSRHAQHTINIHHSFLPAFEGVIFWAITQNQDAFTV
jgi:formyltetrahydrofolate deformylase